MRKTFDFASKKSFVLFVTRGSEKLCEAARPSYAEAAHCTGRHRLWRYPQVGGPDLTPHSSYKDLRTS